MKSMLLCSLAGLISAAVVGLSQEPKPVEDTAIQAAERKFVDEIAKAEEVYKAARQRAAEARMKTYKERLNEMTKKGDFDGATSVKARIVDLETVDTDLVRPRPKDVVRFEGHSYALIKEPVTWHIAKKRCEEMGGHLVCMENSKEAAFVGGLVKQETAWIGASDEPIEGEWRWLTGSRVTVSMKIDNANEADHCLSFFKGELYDGLGGKRWHFVCEWDR